MRTNDELLSSEQKGILVDLLAQKISNVLQRRARLLLLYDEGNPTRDVAQQVGLSPGRVRYWRLRFRRAGLAIFPGFTIPEVITMTDGEEALSQASGEPTNEQTQAAQPAGEPQAEQTQPEQPVGEPVGGPPAEPTQVEQPAVGPPVEQQPPIQSNNASSASLAFGLFEMLREPLGLGDEQRSLLEAAVRRLPLPEVLGKNPSFEEIQAWFEPLTAEGEPQASPDAGDTARQSAVLALATGKLRPKKISDAGLSPQAEGDVLWLAAIVRLANGLAELQSGDTQVTRVDYSAGKVTLIISGAQAEQDAAALQRQVKGWEKTDLPELQIVAAGSAQDAQAAPPLPEPYDAPGVLSSDRMAEAGRKLMRFQFAEMLSHEEGTRQGEDIEELHDMRVATRRLRAAFDVFAFAFEKKALKPYQKSLRRLGRALGSVRDMDVFMEKVHSYRVNLPDDQQSGLDPLLEEWQAQREEARQEMLDYLDSEDYRRLKLDFSLFLDTPGEGARPIPEPPEPDRVCEIAPVLIYTRMGSVRSFDTIVASASVEQLHLLRLEFKKLRYTVEFFREVLGEQSKVVIGELKKLQDHLGELHDAQVATQILNEFLDKWDTQQEQLPIAARQSPVGIVNYLSARHAERYSLMMSFREAWEAFLRPDFRRSLAQAVSVL